MEIGSVLKFFTGLAVIWFYCPFFEWFMHNKLMHNRHPFFLIRWAWRRHAVQHHSENKTNRSFFTPGKAYRWMESSAIPLTFVAHIPLFWLIGKVLGAEAGYGAALGAVIYITLYEVIHHHMHVPKSKDHWSQRVPFWHFWVEYHRVHHHKPTVNYNVVCPLADYVFGTFSLDELPKEPSRPEDMPAHTGPKSVFARRH